MATAAEPGEDGDGTSVWIAGKPTAPARRRGEGGSAAGRERIAAAAVRLLDADGPARFSMRRLAAGLGVTAMSLYWYVDTKHDLLELALDRALGELPAPPRGGAGREGWPDRLRMLARGYRQVLADHPWVAPLAAAYPHPGPHARALDAALDRLLDSAGLDDAGRAGAHLAVRQFLRGCGGPARPVPEGDFSRALDVLIAGISATAAAARPRQGPGPAAR
ncbi:MULTISPECIES: TetR/AcrR family transcriptional regulator [Streptomyces]|uniref:TetR/AcrR family transcriptional regulator n=1 Tax=Streptomyces TaxID=1883 RepID=UPI002F9541DA